MSRHIAYWLVVGREQFDDAPLRAFLEGAAIGELRLAASRNDADPVGEPRRTEVALYRVERGDPPTVTLEVEGFLRVLGQPVPDRPDALLVRWEQDAVRRRWDPSSRPPRVRLGRR